MPSMEERLSLLRWVEGLPAREGANTYDEVLRVCAERYSMTPGALQSVINHHVELFRSTLRKTMREIRKREDDNIPDGAAMREAYEKCMAAAMLRMWTYSSEHYQRWGLPELAPDDSAFDAFLRDAEKDE